MNNAPRSSSPPVHNSSHFLRTLLQRVLVGAWRSPTARVFFAVWLFIFAVTPLREIALTTFITDYSLGDVFDTDESDDAYDISIVSLPVNDAVAHLETSQEPQYATELYRALMKKHPNNKMVIARYLNMSFVHSWIERQPFYAKSSPPPASSGAANSPEMYGSSPSPSSDRIKRLSELISVTQRGQKLDPQNAFFDAIMVRCYVELERDEMAYRVLANSRRKMFYDLYDMDAIRAVGEAARQRHPYAVEYRTILGNGEYWVSRFDFGGEFLQTEMWHREKQKTAQRATDLNAFKVQSLQRRADIAQLLVKILLSRNSSVQLDAHDSLLNLWRYDWSQKATPLYGGKLNDNRRWSRHFADEALKFNRPQIASETLKIASVSDQLFNSLKKDTNEDFSFRKLRNLSNLQAVALGQISFFVALYLFLSVFLNRAEKSLGFDKTTAISAFAGVVCGAIFLSICYFLVITEQESFRFKFISVSEACMVCVVVAPFVVIWLWHLLLKEGDAAAKSNSFSSRLNEYSKLPPLRKILDFMAFSAVAQLWICAAIHFVCAALGINDFKLHILNETFWVNNENGW